MNNTIKIIDAAYDEMDKLKMENAILKVRNMQKNFELLKVKEDMEAALKILQDKLPSEEFYHARACPQRCVPGRDFDDSVECNCKGDSKYMKNSAFQAWENVGNALLAINKLIKE